MQLVLSRLRSNKHRSRWIGVLLGILLTLICAAVGDVLFVARQSETARAALETSNIAAALTQDIQRNIEVFDLSIQGALEQVGKPAVMSAPADLRDAILFDRSATASYLSEIVILDSAGNRVVSSNPLGPTQYSFADHDFFRIHAQRPDFGLFVSRPMKSPIDGQSVVAFSRRRTNPDGSFGGVVAGMLRVEYFNQLFKQINLGPDSSITLFRNDGTVIMRQPYDPDLEGVRQTPSILFNLVSRAPMGRYVAASVVDGINRLYSYRRLGTLPLIVDVGMSTREIYHQWWWRVAMIGTIVPGCCVLIILLTIRLERELSRRLEAEAALRMLVDKDALTGLANRRCFDRVLQAEWSRAVRQGLSLALLMIDVDQFKNYNDALGHAAGDAALRQIAACLAAHIRRPGDLAARYGGEEFVIILPGTDRAAALKIADGLRRAVERVDISHPASNLGRLTVSIGGARFEPGEAMSTETLLSGADSALYLSKRSGRNAVNWHDVASDSLRLAS
ncbi:sensor domain-containing diguanylate cyclase [Lichenifustis flavocetrariae]|uniref:diguanylate cyclase n=1 Tax=Lichenifustis flavocetrariae TaxID=2949735 RepID=A0AA41YYR4_9HYPH|nr:sensor domain-containing diguanylate cyclase [Lichenifustis flavocetrariae]MCW6511054.1 sensor domain-containing diguanylate cyclase [Lichenifustis flavocetrariae]